MTQRLDSRLSLNRETVRRLDSADLGEAAGGGKTASCVVSQCICNTGYVCVEVSVLGVCRM
ncbi:MAG TPA: hypothetical protein VG245_05640 [Candidatus Dormibacteraeota bacterium]|jgi:hypothetical protein|nr:hypothetical protein [Candidatus Dormibacteraeota bacterium]